MELEVLVCIFLFKTYFLDILLPLVFQGHACVRNNNILYREDIWTAKAVESVLGRRALECIILLYICLFKEEPSGAKNLQLAVVLIIVLSFGDLFPDYELFMFLRQFLWCYSKLNVGYMEQYAIIMGSRTIMARYRYIF
ncbi:hypothetical protein P8452_35558 [Trifolium repens]|nr:hypothetical protein P8452_35558 [Trifolium repens]